MKGAWNPLRWAGFWSYHAAKHLDYQQRKAWLVAGALRACAFCLSCALNMEKMMTTREKEDKEEENCKLENKTKGENKLL